MTATPAPVAAIAPMAAMPAHLVRRKAVDIVLRCNSGFSALVRPGNRPLPLRRNRRQRRGLGAGGQRGRAGDKSNKSKGEFQKVAAFHHIPPLHILSDEFRRAEMNVG
jgi:hypothetical protein